MNFAFSETQEMLRQSARQFLAEASTYARVRGAMETHSGYDPEVWSSICERLGWQALIIPEAYGGFGGTYVDLIAVMEEAGRALLCAPLFSTTCLATNALLSSGTEELRQKYLPLIAAGELTATVTFASMTVTARRQGSDFVLSGRARYVIDGCSAKLLIVAASTSAGPQLFAVHPDAGDVTRSWLPTMDATRRQAELTFDEVPASALADRPNAIDELQSLACVALAAEQVGGAQACLDMAVDYAKTRTQFGRPIGSFQAIKHRCADLMLLVESARSAAYYAGWVAEHEKAQLASAASMAKAYCSDAYFLCAAENIQIHGGIGFTWEHPAHLYFKRARSSEKLLGDATFHRDLIAQQLLG